jgi:mono/diheme cytochrome c family protein
MKKILKWMLIGFAGFAGFLVVAILGLYLLGSSRISQASAVETNPVPIRTDRAALDRGKHLVNNISACTSCHGPNLEGKVMMDDAMIGFLPAPNLTRGAGGVGAFFTPEDWESAIRHGIGHDGRVLGMMPSDNYAHYTDEDLSAVIGYIQSLPPVDNELPARSLSIPATIIFGVFDFQNLPISRIQHASIGGLPPQGNETGEGYGRYLVDIASCRDCHGHELAGRTAKDAETGPPAGPNLTSGGGLKHWTFEQFTRAMRAGQTPDGRQLDSEMPWPYYAGMTNDELESIWRYLQSLPTR